ncbi:PHD-finger [Teratosphaeria destructans]|uniref:PHD-finger n=1 Tax=Teratosphaeria destructans TaxID=418781 RepID=A0A9W7W726_9PEZI|nr:PHD-finger [Teratosphaeria destructans]
MSDPPTASPDHQPITNVADDGDIILTLDDKSRLRVQSQSLIIASPVFRAMLDGRFREGQQPRDAVTPLDLELKGDDPNALSRLCHILQHKTVPPKLSSPGTQLVQELVAITEVADKYGCCAAISPQMESILWRFLASSAFRKLSLADAKNLAAVSYFIDHAGTFYVLTRALILEYHKPFTTRKGHHDVVHLSTEICRKIQPHNHAIAMQD